MKHLKAIAAMSLNRVIGQGNGIPWHLPDDFKWFRRMTTGQVVVMGRRTFESIGKPLPNRTTVVLSRAGLVVAPGVQVLANLDELEPDRYDGDVFICGGAQLYAQALPRCSDLYLTLVRRMVEGDVFFPPFEDQFEQIAVIDDRPEFQILHYRNRALF